MFYFRLFKLINLKETTLSKGLESCNRRSVLQSCEKCYKICQLFTKETNLKQKLGLITLLFCIYIVFVLDYL